MKPLRVVGIDPSLTHTGLATAELDLATLSFRVVKLELVKTAGAENVRKSADDLRRATELGQQVRAACRNAALVFAEIPSGAQSARAAFANGVVLGVLASAVDNVVQVSPGEVKRAATGKLNATKQGMLAWATTTHPEAAWLTRKVRGEIRLLNDNEHLADAVAVIQAGLASTQFMQARSLLMGLASKEIQ